MAKEVEITKIDRELMDTSTGEVIHVDEINKQVRGKKAFWKLYLSDFLSVLGIFESKQLDVFIYMLDHALPSNNLFLGTQREIAEGSGVSLGTVSTILKKLQENGFVKKVRSGTYFINPDVLMKGNDSKRQMLITWERNDFDKPAASMVRGEREAFARAVDGVDDNTHMLTDGGNYE